MTDLQDTPGLKMKRLRQKLNKNQGAIAKELGISIPAYSKIESGITDVNLSRLTQIAALFDVEPASLLAGNESPIVVRIEPGIHEEQIRKLKVEVSSLQSKLINAYEQLETIRSKKPGNK